MFFCKQNKINLYLIKKLLKFSENYYRKGIPELAAMTFTRGDMISI